jgi:hypothetical protein
MSGQPPRPSQTSEASRSCGAGTLPAAFDLDLATMLTGTKARSTGLITITNVSRFHPFLLPARPPLR